MEYWTPEEYRQITDDIMARMPVMTYKQFVRSFYLRSSLTGEERERVITQLIRDGLILVSKNMYVTSTEWLNTITEDRINPAFNGRFRLEELRIKPLYRECIDLYNIILDLYPRSADFEISRGLYQMTFVDSEKNHIYELIRIPHEKESLYKVRIMKEAGFTASRNGQLFKDVIRRIAIVESKGVSLAVPYCGFTYICTTDAEGKGFKIVEKRKKDEMWKDCR